MALNKIELKSRNDMVLRGQVLQFIEHIVVHYTKKILDFKRVDEQPEDAFKSYVKNEHEVFYKVRDNLDTFMTKDNKDIKEIAVTVNQIMVSSL
jgi:glutamate dehydrogenase